MKRAPFVLAGTAVGLVAILSFHTRSGTSAVTGQPVRSGPGSARSGHSSGQAGGSTASPAPALKRGAGATSSRTVAGALEQYGYGELAVRVTAVGNRITKITVSALRTAEPYSQQLAAQAIPTLRAEVLSGQTSHVNGVSGATYTSQAYEQSIQAALDKLHLR